MEINSQLLEKLGRLSALKIKPEEEEELKAFLTRALSHFEKIKKIPTQKVAPLVSPLQPDLPLRPDRAEEPPHQKELLDQAPQKQGALVKVPSVV